MKRVYGIVLFLAALALAGQAWAAVKPNSIFTDNCVLQRGMPVPVWGTASEDERVTVAIQGQKTTAKASNGSWMVRLKPLQAGGPFTMTISGSNTVEIKNVLVGEVWIASGQSNMAFTLANSENSKDAIALATDPMLRQGTIPREPSFKPATEANVKWVECSPETAGGFSAVGYYFAKELRKVLGCPVAILNGSRGGTRIEAWMSEGALMPFEGQFDPRKPKTGEEKANWNTASALWNGIVAPIVPYAMRGAIWYQGEANAGNADLYRRTFPAMIADWRKAWGQGDFPFLFVQLAPSMKIVTEPQESAWAELRDAQLYTSNIVPNTAIAIITDAGDPEDIHPKRKKPVGDRLALAARVLAYNEDLAYKGPSFKSMTVVGNRAVLEFDNEAGGLFAKGGDLTGFAVAGEDHKFYNARATVQGRSRVVVSADAVAKPVAVRYAWADCPVANLFNRAGLPAPPFRTDSFPRPQVPKE